MLISYEFPDGNVLNIIKSVLTATEEYLFNLCTIFLFLTFNVLLKSLFLKTFPLQNILCVVTAVLPHTEFFFFHVPLFLSKLCNGAINHTLGVLSRSE
jgi:hypothetical protein